ncbi:MAG: MFS transporter [Ktedonobacteraceae bacterium]|nr:MFS transporter [Ktedonobacteraceae bacterium]
MTDSNRPSSTPLVVLAFFGFVLIGATGAAVGVLLPSQMVYYHVNTAVIGLLFFAFSTGYFLSASSAGLLIQKLDQCRYLTGGTALFLVSTFAFALKPPFILALATNLLLGFSTAIIDVGFNAALAVLPSRVNLLNSLHAFFGLGALLGPLVASAMLTIHWEWNVTYLVWCSLSLPLLIGSVVSLRSPSLSVSTEQAELSAAGNVVVIGLKLHAVWLAMLFLFLAVGIEVSVGIWSYSFLLSERHLGTLLAGWIVSGYWLSLTLGRFLLNRIAKQLHMSMAGTAYSCLAGIGVSTLLIWLLPSTQATTLGFCLIGFFVGPMFPSTIVLVPYLVPDRLVSSLIGILIGISVLGGACFPWLVGTLAQSIGIWVLLPCILALTTIMYLNWWVMTRQLTTMEPAFR